MTWRHVVMYYYYYQLVCTVRTSVVSRAQQVQVAVRCRRRGSRCLVPTSIHMTTCVYVYDSMWRGKAGRFSLPATTNHPTFWPPSPLPLGTGQVENRPTWKVALGWLGGTVIRASACVCLDKRDQCKNQCVF